MKPYILIQSTHLPYSTSNATDAYEAALAATNIGLAIKFVFVDKAIFQLHKKQQSPFIQHKSMAKKLSALPLFDIEDIYVVKPKPNTGITITELVLEDELSYIDHTDFLALCKHAQHILVF